MQMKIKNRFVKLIDRLDKLWRTNPALLYGVAFLLGCYCALSKNPALLFPIAIIWMPLFHPCCWRKKALSIRLVSALATMVIAIAYVHFTVLAPAIPCLAGVQGKAAFEIESLSRDSRSFGTRWVYEGKLISFFPDGGATCIAKNIPCKIFLKENCTRPPANQAYLIEGCLKESASGLYLLVPDRCKPWLPIARSISLAEKRYAAKEKVADYINKNIDNPVSASFLSGIATGNFQDRLMCWELGRFGLQHIMAISGFHFAIVATALNAFLRIFFPRRSAAIALIGMLSLYFLFLGSGPSIMRAWIAITIALAGSLFERRGSGLNSLGAGLLLILIYNPLLCKNMGFQFSFITTGAILTLNSQWDQWLQKGFAKRPLSLAVQMRVADQHGMILLFFFRQSLALGLAVNMAAVPMSLYYFHKFPLMGLIYNLFFPFLVSAAILILIGGAVFSFILPSISSLLHHINSLYTKFVLDYAYHFPTSWDIYCKISDFPQALLIIYLSLLFGFAILAANSIDQKWC